MNTARRNRKVETAIKAKQCQDDLLYYRPDQSVRILTSSTNTLLSSSDLHIVLEAIRNIKPIDMYSRQSLEKQPFNGRLPPEIWLLIFSNLKSFELQTVSLVCQPFRYMAQPLLFSVLDVSPFLLSYNNEQPVLRPQSFLSRLLDRLECYKIPHIAPGVHHVWVSPYTRYGFPPRNSQDDLDPDSVIDALLECLPSFPNLTTLSWHCIDIKPKWWSVIQSQNIKTLWINSSSAPTSPSPLSSVVHLSLDHWPWQGRTTNQVSIHEERRHEVDQMTLGHVIHPDVILSISVPRSRTACHVFAVLSQTISQLQILKIPFFSLSDPRFIPTLWMCPSLEVLCIFPPTVDTPVQDLALDTIPQSCLPCLASYEGPYTHLLNICHQPLKDVSLWGFYDRPALCDPNALAQTLNNFAQRNSVESLRSLTVLVIYITFDLLESFSAFENLEHLTVQSQERDFPGQAIINPHFLISTLYNMVGTIVLPSGLKSIKLDTRLGSEEDLQVQENQAASFIQAFASQYPNVQRIDISYGIYWTGTYTAKWGRIRQTNDEGKEGSRTRSGVRKVDEAGGYSSKSSSNDCLMSTVISSVNPLPLGNLTFTEHRRMIIFQNGSLSTAAAGFPMHTSASGSGSNVRRPWMNLWLRLKRFFGKS